MFLSPLFSQNKKNDLSPPSSKDVLLSSCVYTACRLQRQQLILPLSILPCDPLWHAVILGLTNCAQSVTFSELYFKKQQGGTQSTLLLQA